MINLTEILTQAIANLISGLVVNIVWIILIIWGVKTLAKKIPSWIEQWDRTKMKHYQIERAIGMRR